MEFTCPEIEGETQANVSEQKHRSSVLSAKGQLPDYPGQNKRGHHQEEYPKPTIPNTVHQVQRLL